MKPIIDNFIDKYYPEGSVMQYFGENPGMYDFLGLDGHNGIDIVAPYGTPIKAPCDMVVVEIKYDTGGFGTHVRALGEGYEMTFGHLSNIYDTVKLGCTIKQGEYFCKMGNSGFVVSGATPYWKYNPFGGTHCHFQKRKFTRRVGNGPYNIQYPAYDPITNERIQGTIENYDNGFKGAVNDLKFEVEQTEEEQKKALMMTIISLSNRVIELLNKIIRAKYMA